MGIRENLILFQEEFREHLQRYGRDEKEVKLMAVSKTRTVEELQEAFQEDLTLFGENRVQEAEEKFSHFLDDSYSLILIGHLQSNKVRFLSPRFSGVHSVDSLELAQRLSRHREAAGTPLEILVQVNSSREASKSGFREKEILLDAVGSIRELPYLSMKGLMTMAPFINDERTVRECFADCRDWADEINRLYPDLQASELSMGMSNDYPWAIAEGSTLIRIGTAIFGYRS